MQRRQRANDTAHRARSDENAGASQSAVETSSHRLLRGISTYDAPPAGSHGRLSDPTASSAPERLPRLPSIRAPPVTSVSRGRHSEASGMLSGTTTNAFNIPLRSRQAAPQAGTHQPRVQPFDEIFAEVEAEFSQRDRSRAVGDRRSGPRSFLHTLSRDRRRESDANASSDQLRMGHNAPDPTTSALDALQSELAQLRRDAESNWPPARSGFALQDTTNTGLSDVAGLRARPITRLVNGSDRLGAAAIVPRPETASLGLQDGEQSSLPPFLRRSLRNRGQGVLAPREGALAAALNAQAWMDDFDMGLDLTYEGLLALSERIGPVVHRGASDTALASGLTIFKYASGSSAVGDGETRCAICLEDYEESDECARSNKCNHALHTSCLTVSRKVCGRQRACCGTDTFFFQSQAWLRQANSCPICRQAAV